MRSIEYKPLFSSCIKLLLPCVSCLTRHIHHTRRHLSPLTLALCAALNVACTTQPDKADSVTDSGQQPSVSSTNITPAVDYQALRQKVTYGQADMSDIYQALTEKDVVGLTNTMHGLYSMRWHRAIYYLFQDLWHLNKNKYPDFAWDYLEKTPVRLALASTINRAQIFDTEEFKAFIRAHKYDEHEFHRAQVVIALGLNGDPDDVAYLNEMADSDNVYVSQTAITSLGIAGHPKAQHALENLWIKYQGTPRGDLIQSVLDRAYHVHPETRHKNEGAG